MTGSSIANKTSDKGKGKTLTNRSTASQTRRSAAQAMPENSSEEISDDETAREYLLSNSLLLQDSDHTTAALADALLRITTMNVTRTVRNSIRAVAILLKSGELEVSSLALAGKICSKVEEMLEIPACQHPEPSGATQLDTEKLSGDISRSVADRLLTELASIKTQIKESTTSISDSATKLANNATTYREALQRNIPTAGTRTITAADPKIQAKKDAQAKQLMVDFTDQQDRIKHRNTSLAGIVDTANAALKEAGISGTDRFVSAAKMANGGILLEGSTPTLITRLNVAATQQLFLEAVGTSAVIRARTYNVVAFYVPLTFQTNNEQALREIEEANGLQPHSIVSARWIKPEARRSVTQVFGHAIISFKSSDQANKAIANGLVINQRRVNVTKDKKVPTRCMKCQQWGHMAIACISPGDICGKCGEGHRTANCTEGKLHCTPCGSDGHASWDRKCPVFVTKCYEMDCRTPGNLLTYFPTEEPWTQVATKSPWGRHDGTAPGPQVTPNTSQGHHPQPMTSGRGRPPGRQTRTADPRPQMRQAHNDCQTSLDDARQTNRPIPSQTAQPTGEPSGRNDRSLPPRGRQVNAIASSSRTTLAHASRSVSTPSLGRMRQTTLPFQPTQPSQRLTDIGHAGTQTSHSPWASDPRAWDLPSLPPSLPPHTSSDSSPANPIHD